MNSQVSERLSTHSVHDKMLADVELPPCFVMCRAVDNRWYANLGVQRRSNKDVKIIDFAVPITGFPRVRLLTDPEFERDLITVKIILKESVQPQPRGWITEYLTLQRLLSNLLMFIRAREDLGIDRNSRLTPEAKRAYLRKLRTGGYYKLVDFSSRARAIVKGFASDRLVVPINERHQVNLEALANLFGVQHPGAVPHDALDSVKSYLAAKGYSFRDQRARATRRALVRKLSATRARELLTPWLLLFKYRDALPHDQIPFRPFLNGKEIESEIKKWSRKKGSTKELKPAQVVDLLSKSMALLTDPLVPFVIDLVATLGPNFSISTPTRDFINERLGVLNLGVLGDAYTQNEDLLTSVSFRTLALVFIPIAAACVIAMGTARRKDEIDSLQVGRVTTDKLGQFSLRTQIRKLKNRGVGKEGHMTSIPISATVKLAIDMMEKLKAATAHPSSYLFDLRDPVLETAVALDLTKRLKSFGNWLRVSASDEGSTTELAAHQFRKFFAITYFYRYRFPSLPALSLHMMHLNLDVTRAYLASAARNSLLLQDESKATGKASKATPRDVTRLDDFEEVGRGFVFDILFSAMRGDIKLGGAAGLHLMRDLAKLTEQVGDIVDVHESVDADDALNSILKRFASGKTFRPHPEGHGFCTCDQTAGCLIAANCLRAKSSLLGVDVKSFNDVDHDYAEDLTCGTCVHHFTLPELWPYWDNEITRCEQALDEAHGEQRRALEERLEGLRNYEANITWQWAA
ncbi:hypothetical protein E0H93_26495 [Rhizobium leguminosarum bv. viciae]|uniref:hypothetical protein n=1 Tax=Rhizobium leguminosarum TaxID=384 RepID=UPI00103C7DB7|nr:hypothetical protein [Rhizobium leguminosarum]TBY30145.1 hypothetical protein E0H55_21950 [Rhizobium leguminosarum bv. viciae]TCB01008.1 hypothetical protein E0H93_26495 [Rhizobium leguminosarum bv. viciae]